MNAPTPAKRISTIDTPTQQMADGFDGTFWNSDTIAELLRALGLEYVAICPGSSFRGLHESLVNCLGNRRPEMLLCLHEENAVAVAHGYARVTGKPMGVIVHSNVGLMHATMAVYNAWCDRMPVMILGGVGPLDAARRRTPIDWLHSVADQGALVRNYVKWDDQPLSPKAAVELLLRGHQMACTAPKAPVYITLDQRLQEDSFAYARSMMPDVGRFRAPAPPAPDLALIETAAELLLGARSPVILAGRVSRDETAWAQRVRLAEFLGARVLTDLKVAAAFPSDHPLHGPDPAIAFTPDDGVAIMRDADVILSLDWWDQATLFNQAWGEGDVPAKVIRCSIDSLVHRGWTRDHMGLTPVDLDILAEPDHAVPALLAAIERRADEPFRRAAAERLNACRASRKRPEPVRPLSGNAGDIGLWDIGATLSDALGDKPYCLMRAPLGWHVGECRSVIRSTISAPTVPQGSAARPACRSALRLPCAAAAVYRSRCSAMATTLWAFPLCGRPRVIAFRYCSSSQIIQATTSTNSTKRRRRWRASARPRRRSSASAYPILRSTFWR